MAPLPNVASLNTKIMSHLHRPGSYLTVVAAYLISSLAVSFDIAHIDSVRYGRALAERHVTGGAAGLQYVILVPWLALLTVFCVAGATMLLLRRKWAIYVSIFALLMMCITLPLAVDLFFNYDIGLDRNVAMNLGNVSGIIALAVNLGMFPILIFGWRKIRRRPNLES